VIVIYTTIKKWGNSQAVRIPKAILEMVNLEENDRVEIKVQDGNMLIIPIRNRRTLAERIAEYNGEYQCDEWDTGKPSGNEVW